MGSTIYFMKKALLYSPFDSLIHWVTTGWGIKRQIMTMSSWRWEWRREGQHYRYLKASIFIKVMLWPILWSPNAKSRLIGKDPDAGKDWRQKKKRLTEDGMAEWHHWCNGHELGKTPGDSEEQGGLACCSPWDCEVRHNWVTEQQQRYDKWKLFSI